MMVAITPQEFEKWGIVIGATIGILLAGVPAVLLGYRKGKESQARKKNGVTIPIGKDCPQCGATEYNPREPATMVAFQSDRECKSCGILYSPPTPAWAGIVFCAIALGGFGCIVWLLILRFTEKLPDISLIQFCFILFAVLSLSAPCLTHGIRTLRKQSSLSEVDAPGHPPKNFP